MSSAAAALATTAGDARDRVVTFKAPLLDRILAASDEPAPRIVALDLGGPCQALLDRLAAAGPCRVEIADFIGNDAPARLNGLESLEDQGPGLIRELLPAPNEEALDLILCWDLPNYLGLPALRFLLDVLGRRADPGCKLHMLIAYSKREMAASPARYVPQTDGTLVQIRPSDETRAAPRYSPEALGQAVGGFDYERGVLLANGMQEFVYAWPEPPGGGRRPY